MGPIFARDEKTDEININFYKNFKAKPIKLKLSLSNSNQGEKHMKKKFAHFIKSLSQIIVLFYWLCMFGLHNNRYINNIFKDITASKISPD